MRLYNRQGSTPEAQGTPLGEDPGLSEALRHSLAEQRPAGSALADADLRAAIAQSLEVRARDLACA